MEEIDLSLTSQLVAASGDIRRLTTYQADKMTAGASSDAKKGGEGGLKVGGPASAKSVGEDGEKDDDDQEEGKVFVRPARLHLRNIRDPALAMIEGLPSQTELNLTLNPEEMINYFDVNGKSSGGGTIREAFDNQFEMYTFYRSWRPSRGGLPSISDRQMLWRHAMLMIASHLDSGEPLHRVICWTLNDTAPVSPRILNPNVKRAGGNNNEIKQSGDGDDGQTTNDGTLVNSFPRGVIIDIEAIKQMKTSGNPNTPVVFVRYAESNAGPGGLLTETLEQSAKELPNHGSNQRTIHCTSEEIEYILSILDEAREHISSSYLKKWKKRSTFNESLFKFSFIRPALAPGMYELPTYLLSLMCFADDIPYASRIHA